MFNYNQIFNEITKTAGILRHSKLMEDEIYKIILNEVKFIKQLNYELPYTYFGSIEIQKDLPDSYGIDYSKIDDLQLNIIFYIENKELDYSGKLITNIVDDKSAKMVLNVKLDKLYNIVDNFALKQLISHELTHLTQHLIKISKFKQADLDPDSFVETICEYIKNNFKELLKTKNKDFIEYCRTLINLFDNYELEAVYDKLSDEKYNKYVMFLLNRFAKSKNIGAFKNSLPFTSDKAINIDQDEYYYVSGIESQTYLKESINYYISENSFFSRKNFNRYINGMTKHNSINDFWNYSKKHNPKGYKILIKEFYKELINILN